MNDQHTAEQLAEAILDTGYNRGESREIVIDNITYSVTYNIFTICNYDNDGVLYYDYIHVTVYSVEAFNDEGDDIELPFTIYEVEQELEELLAA